MWQVVTFENFMLKHMEATAPNMWPKQKTDKANTTVMVYIESRWQLIAGILVETRKLLLGWTRKLRNLKDYYASKR